jgi:hypothetical protein
MSFPTKHPQSVLNNIYFLQFQQTVRELLSTPSPPTVLIIELLTFDKNLPGCQCQNIPHYPFKDRYYNIDTHESTCCLGGCETQVCPPTTPSKQKEAKKQRALKRKAILAAGGGVRCECCQKGFQTQNHFYTKHVAKCGK